MAEAGPQAHTFKLVLVGDGGTGKASFLLGRFIILYGFLYVKLIQVVPDLRRTLIYPFTSQISVECTANGVAWLDYLREASLDGRV